MTLKKRLAAALIALSVCLAAGIWLFCAWRGAQPSDAVQAEAPFETGAGMIWHVKDGKRQVFDLRGAAFESRNARQDAEHLEWLAQMNVNTLLVSSDAPEEFYRTLAAFNEGRTSPVYLLQGVDGTSDARCRAAVDRVHRTGVSDWVIGYIADARALSGDEAGGAYRGKYLFTAEDATKGEARLARAGEVLLSYESEKYGIQRLIAFAAEAIGQDGCFDGKLDFERILPDKSVKSGLFALYFAEESADFLERKAYYRDWYDENGESNPYLAYLIELCDRYEMPVVISGLTAQGASSEAEQARRVTALYEDVLSAGCAGAVLDSWQDDWDLWCDLLDPAQSAGVVARECGAWRMDGLMSEWEQIPLSAQGDGLMLQIGYDARAVYFRVYAREYDFEGETVYVCVDAVPSAGARAEKMRDMPWLTGTDFVLVLDGKENSRVQAHEDAGGGSWALGYADGSTERADFAVRGEGIEIAVPWRMLGFEDPSRCLIAGADGKSVKTAQISAALVRSDGTRTQTGSVRLDGWNAVQTELRAKDAYYALRDAFGARKTEFGE